MPKPLDIPLYKYVLAEAKKKFSSKSGVYRSSWIVRTYKKLGGRYSQTKKSQKSGLKRWYEEKWVNLNQPIYNSKGKIIGYESCGRSSTKKKKSKYPLCRPSKRVNSQTPKTIRELTKKQIEKAKREKSKVKGSKNIKF